MTQAEAMAAYTRSILEPLVALVERQAGEIAELREDRGRQAAELERAASTIVTLNAALEARAASASATASSETSTPLRRSLGLWRWLVLVLVVAVTTMVTLLAWPR